MSRKSERLVNLTIALLSTKRYLTKSEIFSKVEGYDGDSEARDRMFERDKDELRQIGIDIQVGQIDPFFEDEVGYRILRSRYGIQLKDLTPRQLTLISLAQDTYDEHALSDSARSAQVKFKAMGFEVDTEIVPSLYATTTQPPNELSEIVEAIASKKSLTFSYFNSEYEPEERIVFPYGISQYAHHWYFAGLDTTISAIRTFRLDRCASQFTLSKKSDVYEIPVDYKISLPEPISVEVNVRLDRCYNLRRNASVQAYDDEWERLTISFPTIEDAMHAILWEGLNARVVAPIELVTMVRHSLERVVQLHG